MIALERIRIKRARLIERASAQRADIGMALAGLETPLRIVDKGIATMSCVIRHPGLLAAGAVFLAVVRPRGMLHWARRAFALWRAAQWARATLPRLLGKA